MFSYLHSFNCAIMANFNFLRLSSVIGVCLQLKDLSVQRRLHLQDERGLRLGLPYRARPAQKRGRNYGLFRCYTLLQKSWNSREFFYSNSQTWTDFCCLLRILFWTFLMKSFFVTFFLLTFLVFLCSHSSLHDKLPPWYLSHSLIDHFTTFSAKLCGRDKNKALEVPIIC